MAKRTRERQLKKLAERRALERRRRQRRKQILSGLLVVVLVGGAAATAFALLRGGGGDPPEPQAAESPQETIACGGQEPPAASIEKPQFDQPPVMQLGRERDYTATVVTSCGTIELDLFEDETPRTVNNFVFLARKGFYNGTTFHRIVEDFMIQGGDPEGTGSGGPGYTFDGEFIEGLTFDEPGLLAMANPNDPDANGSQWFITVAPAEHLNERHTIFGEVTSGMDVVREINRLPAAGAEGDSPTQTIYVERVRISAR